MLRAILPILLLVGGGLAPAAPEPGPDGRVETHRPEVIWIPGGWFLRGSSQDDVRYGIELCTTQGFPACPQELFAEEEPQERVWVSAYGMDRTEVTHGAWRRCVAANACPPTRMHGSDVRVSLDEHPVAGVTWLEARDYCAHVGGRLPTEAEWERAARGHDGRRFPWGNHWNPRLSNHGQPEVRSLIGPGRPDGVDGHRYAAPVGSYPHAASPYGLVDMAGNVWEWTADVHDPEAYQVGLRVDPRGGRDTGRRVIRGGSWQEPPWTHRVTTRASLGEGQAMAHLGFRCAHDRRPDEGVAEARPSL